MLKPLDPPGRRTLRAIRLLALAAAIAAVTLSVCGPRSRADDASTYAASGDPTAEDQLQAAHDRATQARQAAEKAKRELDRYVARHFDQQQQRAEEPVSIPDFPRSGSQPESLPPPTIEAEWLLGQIHRLRLERAALMSRFTAAHPQVIEMDVRLADLRRQLDEARNQGDDDDQVAPEADAEGEAKRELTERLSAEKERDREAAQQYRKAVVRWQKAERQARTAAEAEAAASEQASAERKKLPVSEPPAEPERAPRSTAPRAIMPPVAEVPEEYPPPVAQESPPIEPAPAVTERGEMPAKPAPPAAIEPESAAPAQPSERPRLPAIVPPPNANSEVQSTPDDRMAHSPSSKSITVTRPAGEKEQPPATFYPAADFEPQDDAKGDEVAATPESRPLKPRRKPPADGAWVEAAPESADQTPSERLVVKRPARKTPAVSRPAADAPRGERTLEPQMPVPAESPWIDESFVESDLTDESQLDEPFPLEGETPSALIDVAPLFDPDTVTPSEVDAEQASPEGDAPTTPDDSAPADSPRGGSRSYSDGIETGSGGGGGASLEQTPPAGRPRRPARASSDEASATPEDRDAAASTAIARPRSISQGVALALIVAAVVVAATAAIWLARSSRDRAFADPDAVSCELSLPLVAVVPPIRPRTIVARRRRPRAVLLLGQVLLAVGVFGAVAYTISKPGLVERVCSQSIATLDRAWSSVRQR